jgi:hypothetical protein
MVLDRGALARIDRKLLAGLGQEETFQMVRVPATAAKWATWKRYCDAAGISMGRAIMALIDHELVRVFGESAGDEAPLVAGRAEERLALREAQVDARERDLDQRDERLGKKEAHLAAWQRRLQKQGPSIAPQRAARKIGRNEQCPCGSGFKYKLCHGIGDRRRDLSER